jgi:hypothetical protein
MGRVNAPKAKLTWQIAPSWRGTASYLGKYATFENANASRWTQPEATSYNNNPDEHFALGVDGMLNKSLLWTTRIGYDNSPYEERPMSGDLESITHRNTVTGIDSNNYYKQEINDFNRVQTATDLTWFFGGSSGTHELKAGLAVSDMSSTVSLCVTGTPGGVGCIADVPGFVFDDTQLGGEDFPLYMWEEYNPGPVNFDGRLWSGYVQDAWRPTPNLTVKAGVRFDSITYDMERTGASVTMDRWQPRLGFAWDLTGDARNVVRVSAGRYMDPATMNLPYMGVQKFTDYVWGSCSLLATGQFPGFPVDPFDPALCPILAAGFGTEWRTDLEGWDPHGWFLMNRLGSNDNIIDPNLESAYSDQLILNYERALWPRSSVEFSLVFKQTRGLFEDTCNGNVPNPTQGSECDYFYLYNMAQLKRDYEAFIVKLESRSLDWLTVLASYTLSSSEGNHESLGFGWDWDLYPWHWENRNGYLDNHHLHDLKINGYVLLPLDFTIAVNAGWQSGFRWTPIIYYWNHPEMPAGGYFDEPRGNREGPSDTWLDLQITKGFRIGPTHLELIVSVLNLLSREEVTGVCENVYGCDEETRLGDPTNWDTPRAWEVGFRLTF